MAAPLYDPRAVEAKWQRVWEDKKVYRGIAAPAKPKFFSTVPYPYMSGYQHLGFAVPFLRAEFLARFKRMTGYSVLFPQGFHCTGLPILGAAKRVAEGEPVQIQILRDMGIPEREIPRFADPLHWIEVFPQATMDDLRALGAGVDWSRSFITTHLNPPYDAFVRWQFRRLREAGHVEIGSHPVVWCPKDQAPIGDHDRLEGEGVQPVEFTLLKFPFANLFLVAATLRPETVFGQTNLWVDPEVTYVKAEVDGETWVVNRSAAEKLREQGHSVTIGGEVSGRDLVGREVVAPGIERPIPVLPGKFLDQARGTGIVTSVPSDAPDDWMALRDLQRDAGQARAFGLDPAAVAALRPIPIIRSEGWGPLPAVEIAERMGIEDQMDRERLEAAKAEIYRTGYYTGVMTEAAGEFAGMRVDEAKERIRARLLETGQASTLWEPAEEVVCRCATRAIVKVVSDQWFLTYGNPEWKKAAHAELDRMVLYPESVRKQFHYTIDWLKDWACAHHKGLGTKLPWDDHWVIESLSDSTVYMAYYTIAHVLQDGKLRSELPWAAKVTDAFFDYVFLSRGDVAAVAAEIGVDARIVDQLRKEFQYWYPLDLRSTGKDLVQNHMTFCLFNHVALFPERTPRGYAICGFVRLGERKMSKSKGNAWYIRTALEEWGADVIRMMVANAGDGIDDPRLDLDFADAAQDRLYAWHAFATAKGPASEEATPLDAWFLSVLNRSVLTTREAIGAMEYRGALRTGFFDLQSAWEWYAKRVGTPNRAVRERFVETQTKLLAVFAPHLCEEVWQAIGKSDFIVRAPFPEVRSAETNPAAEAAEAFLRATLADAREILKVTGLAPKTVSFFIAPAWKRQVYAVAATLAREGRLTVPALMERLAEDPDLRRQIGEAGALAKRVVEEMSRRRADDLAQASVVVDEREYLRSARPFLERELRSTVAVHEAGDPDARDPKGKSRHALPGRPAIYVE
ncbi:MAG TPA: leucine--tRNA ligase [Thermoplasmata archaeon]|nr:leucine--tRNA ligase [Thermoplasmata archaeon]